MTKLASFGSGAVLFAIALTGGATMSTVVAPHRAHADDCLLDTNDDGFASANTDTDGGANSAGADNRLACGVGATAGGKNSSVRVGIAGEF